MKKITAVQPDPGKDLIATATRLVTNRPGLHSAETRQEAVLEAVAAGWEALAAYDAGGPDAVLELVMRQALDRFFNDQRRVGSHEVAYDLPEDFATVPGPEESVLDQLDTEAKVRFAQSLLLDIRLTQRQRRTLKVLLECGGSDKQEAARRLRITRPALDSVLESVHQIVKDDVGYYRRAA